MGKSVKESGGRCKGGGTKRAGNGTQERRARGEDQGRGRNVGGFGRNREWKMGVWAVRPKGGG